ncbi:unnamed protein product [Amoebophrya sp. A25]|nr:unnamed protein product [Amoebophrya sp. A25]|eukprot:GSA25T00009544001.1
MRVLAALTAAQLFGAGQHALGVAADSAIDLSGGALAVAEQQAWSVSSVSRSIKLSANTASATVTMQIENVGKVPLDSFAVRWSTAFSARVGHITASRKGGAGSFTVAMQPGLPDGISEIKSAVINLDQTAAKGEKMTLVYTLHMGLPYVPLPKEIDLFQDQWLVFEDSQCVPSPYNIGKQTTVAELPDSAGEVESFTEGAQRQGKKITWDESFCQGGKASITDSGEKKPLRIHFGHNAHQAYFKTVKREIEVSHWGNIAFTEDYKLHHGGAQMTGSFSRVSFTWADYRDKGMQTPPNPVVTGMQELSAVLPKTARNLHYRDEIGNISSSNARRDDRGYVLAQIRPRYPLLGGWNADWAFSYDVPTRSALKVDVATDCADIFPETNRRSVIAGRSLRH